MVKKLKSILILVLGLVFSLSCLSMCILAQKAFADNSSFYIEGAAFRIPASTEENFGIRFKAHIDSITYGNAKSNDATFGVLIVPEDLKGDNAQIKDISGLIPEEENGEYVFSGAVYDILWSNVTRPFTAKAYYKVGNEYTYADGENWFDSRTLFTMATQVLVENDEQYESYTENFNTIINYALDRGYVENGFTVNTEDVKILGVGTTFTVTGSVKNSTNESKVLAAYPIVTVTDSEGTPINGIIELVGGTQNTYKVIGKAENATIKMQVGTSANAIVKTFEGYSFRDEGAVAGVSGAYAKNATLAINNDEITNITLMGNEVGASADSYSYVGFESGFDVGKTLAINWHGKVMPGIGLFLDDAPENTVIGGLVDGGSGIYYANNSYWGTSYRYIAAGPYRYISNDANKATARVDGLTHFGPTFPDSAEMGYDNLDSSKDYRLEITITSADETSNQANLAFAFYEVGENGALTSVTTFTKTSTLADINYNSTAFAFYGYNRASHTHSFTFELYDPNVERSVDGIDGAYSKRAIVNVNNSEVTKVTLPAVLTDMDSASVTDTTGYLGFESGLGVGKTLAVYFTGKQMPMIGLFLSGAPEGEVIGGVTNSGTGLILTNYAPHKSSTDARFYCLGPNRVHGASGVGGHLDAFGYYGKTGSSSSEIHYSKLTDGQAYCFELTVKTASSSTVSLLYELYKEDTGEQVMSITKSSTVSGIDLTSTAFAFYSNTRKAYGDITFSFDLYETGSERYVRGVSGAYAKGADLTVENGAITSVTLAAPVSDMHSATTSDSDVSKYVGFESGFGVGRTLAINWTGKTLPCIGLFLDDAPEGQTIGGLIATGTGIVLANGNGWANGRFLAFGPNRCAYGKHNDSLGYYGTDGTNASAEMARDNLSSTQKYRIEISILEADDTTDTVSLSYVLYKVLDDSTTELVKSVKKDSVVVAGVNYNSTAFAFYSPLRAEFGTATFSFEIYDTPQA